jgi:hypothetical protein
MANMNAASRIESPGEKIIEESPPANTVVHQLVDSTTNIHAVPLIFGLFAIILVLMKQIIPQEPYNSHATSCQ